MGLNFRALVHFGSIITSIFTYTNYSELMRGKEDANITVVVSSLERK
jgi:hypothetical protein